MSSGILRAVRENQFRGLLVSALSVNERHSKGSTSHRETRFFFHRQTTGMPFVTIVNYYTKTVDSVEGVL